MTRFIEGKDRHQPSLLPDCLDDYVGEDSPVRVVDIFVDELDIEALGFEGPAATGRPGYHPRTMLKLYIYGYLNQVQSSRRLEREAGRNTELMWLTGKLAPDFKTIADFRRDHGEAIRATCRYFIELCRRMGLLGGGVVALDGSRFKASNTRDRNYTRGVIERRRGQVAASIDRYLSLLDAADRLDGDEAVVRAERIAGRIDELRRQMQALNEMEREVAQAPEGQVSLTDPDARAMATHGKGTGMVGYNVQAAVDTTNHLIVAHEVTNVGHDRNQLSGMAVKAREATGADSLSVLADRGYFSGEEVLACEAAGITPYVPRPLTSSAKAQGRWGKQDFSYERSSDTYRCPAGEALTRRFSSVENDLTIHTYWSDKCGTCALKPSCTTGKQRRIKRWEHEQVIDAMQRRLERMPAAMRIRKRTVEHVFGTIKGWMGAQHFQTRTKEKVATEMSLHVLAYNLKRATSLLGPRGLIEGIRV